MTDTPERRLEAELDALGRAARASAPEPSEALVARVLADAAAIGATRTGRLPERRAARWRLPRLPRPALAGATALACLGFGLWLGYAAPPPAALEDGTTLAGLEGFGPPQSDDALLAAFLPL